MIPGLALLFMGVGDLLWTTFLEGAGPLTRFNCDRVGRFTYFLFQRFHRRGILVAEGLLAAVSTVLMWTLFVWAGWAFIFCAAGGALISTETGASADTFSRIYFAGSTVFTLGLGDYRPVTSVWKFVTATAAANGFFIFGLQVAYLVPAVSAVTQKRQLALSIWGLGKSPDEILIRAWNGVDTTALVPHLVALTTMLALLSENHSTYPILHLFHSRKRSSSIAPRIAALDEALTILECGLQSGCSLDVPSLGAAREAITEFLQTLKRGLVTSTSDVPPTPSLKTLRDVGVPAVEEPIFEAALRGLAARRRLLLALVKNEGWTWEEVWPTRER